MRDKRAPRVAQDRFMVARRSEELRSNECKPVGSPSKLLGYVLLKYRSQACSDSDGLAEVA